MMSRFTPDTRDDSLWGKVLCTAEEQGQGMQAATISV